MNVYATAFDEVDKNLCFLKAWIVLEILLNTDKNDKLINRIVSIYHDDSKEFIRQDLECLREFRNSFVHNGINYTNPLVACYRLQRYIRAIVNYHLRFTSQFSSMIESLTFLDTYGMKQDILFNKKKILEKVIKLKTAKNN